MHRSPPTPPPPSPFHRFLIRAGSASLMSQIPQTAQMPQQAGATADKHPGDCNQVNITNFVCLQSPKGVKRGRETGGGGEQFCVFVRNKNALQPLSLQRRTNRVQLSVFITTYEFTQSPGPLMHLRFFLLHPSFRTWSSARRAPPQWEDTHEQPEQRKTTFSSLLFIFWLGKLCEHTANFSEVKSGQGRTKILPTIWKIFHSAKAALNSNIFSEN